MAVTPVDPGIPVPDLGSFPLNSEQVYNISFSSLDEEEEDPTPDPSTDGESSNSSKIKEKKLEAKKKAKEQRKQTREQAKEEIKKSINEKLQDVGNAVTQISTSSAEVVANAPNLLGQKVYLTQYEATNIAPLEVQLAIMTAQAALGALPGTAPALAAADAAALTQQIVTLRDDLAYKEMVYQQKVAAYKTSVATVTVMAAVITTFCTLFQLTEEPSVAAFLATLNSVVAALNALVAVL